jgi:hypothetical protein
MYDQFAVPHLSEGRMTAGYELIPTLIIDLVVPPVMAGLWLLFVSANNGIVRRNGGSRIEGHPWQLLIQMYVVVLFLTLVHLWKK